MHFPLRDERGRLFDLSMILFLLAVAAFMAASARYYSVFDDEAFSCRRYVLPAGEIVRALWNQTEPDPPLYYVAVHGWMRLFGVTPLAMRGLSILFFIVGVAFLGAAGRTWYEPRVGRWTMVIAALHPLHLFFGFAARWYSLLFLCVAALLWATANLRVVERPARRWIVAWVLAATAACYTNYFAPAMVGLLSIGLVFSSRRNPPQAQRWLLCVAAVAALYAPWVPAWAEQLRTFPRAAHAITDYGVAAARTLVALATGNLADPGMGTRAEPGAWWVWGPMATFALVAAGLLARNVRRHGVLTWLCAGSAAAGIGTLTMIDKYVMSFSAPACLLVAALLAGSRTNAARGRRVALVALAAAWGGCYVNLARQAHWTSVRWLDPFAETVAEVSHRTGPGDVVAATHPAVGYYWGIQHMNDTRFAVEGDAMARWRRAEQAVRSPNALLSASLLADTSVRRVWLIETAATAADARACEEFKTLLSTRFDATAAALAARDPAAERKDRLDRSHAHPAYRIAVRVFERTR